VKKITFPLVVKAGSVSVRIYRTPSNGCDSFTLSYYQDGLRKRPTFPTLQAARDEADIVVNCLGNADGDILTLTSADRAAYLRARQLLDPFCVAIETAAAQFMDARKQLGDVSLAHAVEFYLKRHPVKLQLKPVNVVVAELLAAKEADGCGERYLESLRYCLGKFAARFHINISAVAGTDVDVWLRESGLSPRTRNNLRSSVQILFSFAKAKRYLPKDHDEIESVAVANDRDGDIEVFTPAELGEILKNANERMIPFLVLGAFAGIRHAEIQRLDWINIHFEDGIIEIGAAKAKTASRRIVPIVPNLRKWLMKFRQGSGSIVTHNRVDFELRLITKRVNETRRAAWAKAKKVGDEQVKQTEKQARQNLIKSKAERGKPKHRGEVPSGSETAQIEGWVPFAWKHNGLRHSFISYRVADIQNVAQVALEAGNSPQMIFQHYRELVRAAAAKEWFAIEPKKS
jgi:integrase